MTCSTDSNQISFPIGPGPVVPGFNGPAISPISITPPSFNLPTDLLHDLNALIQQLGVLFPSGLFNPNPDFNMKTVYDAIGNLLSQLAPYLSFYNFIQAAIKIIVCIIDILCALPNPIAVALKLKDLFVNCLRPFILLFPFLALIAMIIALLLLILALILFIIQTIEDVIKSIIKNLEILGRGLQLKDAKAVLAAAQKIASLLCFIQNVLAILLALASILAVIESLAKLAGFNICSNEDKDGCCDPSICPPFIKDTPNGITTNLGTLVYFPKVGFDTATALSLPPDVAKLIVIPPVRPETWQVYDSTTSTPTYPIYDIILPNIFLTNYYPDDTTYSATTPKRQAPYTANIRLKVDPALFGVVDFNGPRYFNITDCIVVRKPYIGVHQFNNTTIAAQSPFGTMNIEGGLVTNDDGSPYLINGVQATLNTFIHLPDITSSAIPSVNDSITFTDVTFTWFPNSPALAGLNLTTVGCIPELNLEKAILNAVLTAEGIEPVAVKLPTDANGNVMPDVSGTLKCANAALAAFRKDVTTEGCATFQSTITGCLTALQAQTTNTLCAATTAAVSQFKTELSLIPDLQFTSEPIQVKVTLRDAAGTLLGKGLPQTCVDGLQDNLKGEATFGEISKFTFDGVDSFIADITSTTTGAGEVTVSFQGKIFSIYTPSSATVATPSITENVLIYTFIASGSIDHVRRDVSDLAQE